MNDRNYRSILVISLETEAFEKLYNFIALAEFQFNVYAYMMDIIILTTRGIYVNKCLTSATISESVASIFLTK